MFRCDSCGSGYSVQAAATWDSCPRCLAKEQIRVPLTFELGWRQSPADSASQPSSALVPERAAPTRVA